MTSSHNDGGSDIDNAPKPGMKTLEGLIVEKERLRESEYRDYFSQLFKKNRGIFQQSHNAAVADDFVDEAELLRHAMRKERDAWMVGIALGLTTFLSLRYLPRYVIFRFGGEEKMKALRDADARARLDNSKWAKNVVGVLVEGSFSAWAAWSGYNLASQKSEGTYEILAQVPLCKGRSTVADALCDEWTDIASNQIPPTFWQNLDEEGQLQDERVWRAIRLFAANCMKRKAYEGILRKDTPNHEPISLPNRVPDDVLSSDFFSKDQATHLASDRK